MKNLLFCICLTCLPYIFISCQFCEDSPPQYDRIYNLYLIDSTDLILQIRNDDMVFSSNPKSRGARIPYSVTKETTTLYIKRLKGQIDTLVLKHQPTNVTFDNTNDYCSDPAVAFQINFPTVYSHTFDTLHESTLTTPGYHSYSTKSETFLHAN